jgi:hypothetical protein
MALPFLFRYYIDFRLEFFAIGKARKYIISESTYYNIGWPNNNSLSIIKFMKEGHHILFADIEDRLGTLLMRWSVPAARAAFRPILAV